MLVVMVKRRMECNNPKNKNAKPRNNKYRNKRLAKPGEVHESIRKDMCPVCKERPAEISMTCAGMHTYCFECIKNWADSKKELSCPECRKVCPNLIVLPIEKEKQTEELKKFITSVKIIPNPRRHGKGCTCFENEFDNTAVYPDWTLQHFVDNKQQLELYHKNKDEFSESDLSKLIHWNMVSLHHHDD
jgi:hypothetical protein